MAVSILCFALSLMKIQEGFIWLLSYYSNEEMENFSQVILNIERKDKFNLPVKFWPQVEGGKYFHFFLFQVMRLRQLF